MAKNKNPEPKPTSVPAPRSSASERIAAPTPLPVARATGAPVYCPQLETQILADINGHMRLPGFGLWPAGHPAMGQDQQVLALVLLDSGAVAARQELEGTGVRVTLIEPGIVETPFYDSPVSGLEADDIARIVMWAVSQPAHVDVNEVLVRPTRQST